MGVDYKNIEEEYLNYPPSAHFLMLLTMVRYIHPNHLRSDIVDILKILNKKLNIIPEEDFLKELEDLII